jgi:hypothetical protein
MTNLTNTQKKEWAKTIYLKEHSTQKDIAKRVGTSEQTLCKWIADEGWEHLRHSVVASKSEQLERAYMQLTELNDSIMARAEGTRFANSKEADTLVKLSSIIKNLENDTSITDIVNVSIDMVNWYRTIDFLKAKEISNVFDLYIKHKLNE